MNLLTGLNAQQKEAVLCIDGPLLVLAGAGSGKTKALTHRIAYLIKEKGVSPYSILAVTFTNKAAGEMSERVAKLLAGENHLKTEDFRLTTKLPWLGTFHSICVRILRREAHNVGYERNFTIYDAGDSLSLVKRIMKEYGIDPKHYPPNAIANFISGAKNEIIDAKEYKKYTNSPLEITTSKVYTEYEKRLKAANAMDFDDLLMNCVILFQKNPKILEHYQLQFKYILIDEYQDTNHVQYMWAKLLAEKHKNIMVVGDDYQAIYGWRGANFRNILNFERDYKNAKVIKLEQNYRSTQTILSAADNVIKFNKQRTEKTLWTDNEAGVPVTVYKALNEKDEAEFVTLEIRSLAKRCHSEFISESHGIPKQVRDDSEVDYSRFAVLYRTNAQSRVMEEVLMRFGIPYRIVGGYRFYERKEIKDIIAYLRLINNTLDFEALDRAVSSIPRGIGPKALEQTRQVINTVVSSVDPLDKLRISSAEIEGASYQKISPPSQQSARSRNDNLFVTLSEGEESLKLPSKVREFFKMLASLKELSEKLDLAELIRAIAARSGYKDYLLADKTVEGEARWENIEELMGVAAGVHANVNNQVISNNNQKNNNSTNNENWEMETENSETALELFLQQVALVQDTDNLNPDESAVTLMTMHSAKGLEFENIFIIGAEEGLFPHSRALLDESEMEEERRLAYVGITRARKRLYLIYAGERIIFGRFQSNPKSRFIEHIPEELLDEIE